jgi:hypothetical protein
MFIIFGQHLKNSFTASALAKVQPGGQISRKCVGTSPADEYDRFYQSLFQILWLA